MDVSRRPGLGTSRDWALRLTAGLILGVFLGTIGPFGTYGRPLAVRVAEWTLGACLGTGLLTLVVRYARWRAAGSDLPLWFTTGLAVGAAGVPYSVALGLLFNARYWLHGGWPVWLEFYGDYLLIAAPATVGALLLPRAQASMAPRTAYPELDFAGRATTPIKDGDLLSHLPARLGRELVALQMEDHYVRAHTRRGSDLLLMSMGQAMAALPTLEGARVHRSWWVARNAVEGVVWEGRNLRLRLIGGLEAPVARAQVATLRSAAWLPGDS